MTSSITERIRLREVAAEEQARAAFVALLHRHDALTEADVDRLRAACDTLKQSVATFDEAVDTIERIAELEDLAGGEPEAREKCAAISEQIRKARTAIPSQIVEPELRNKLEAQVRQLNRELNMHQRAIENATNARAEADRLKGGAWWWKAYTNGDTNDD